MFKLLKKITCASLLILYLLPVNAQVKTRKQTATIMFYNVENLYDTLKSADFINGYLLPDNPKYQISISEDSANILLRSDPEKYKVNFELSFDKLKNKKVVRKQILTEEFYYQGTKIWNYKKYNAKIKNIATVISEVGKLETHTIPAVVGLSEIENEHVLKDLCKELQKTGITYSFSHFNSFDARGVDVALLYDTKRVKISEEKRLPVILRNEKGYRDYTRDILMVKTLLDGEEMYFFVNHWPSRRGGEQKSLPKRIAAAKVVKTAMNHILENNPKAKILVMGDFNDDPNSPSIKKIFNTVYKKNLVTPETFFNPAERLFRKGIGTLAYKDSFNFFDQMIMSPAWVLEKSGYFHYKTAVYSPPYLISQEGPFKGYPFRSFSGNNYTGGYSDHYPVYTLLIRDIKN